MSTRVYLAGPEVFLPAPEALYDAKKRICQRHGLVGVSPLDHLLDLSKLAPQMAGCLISEGNERHMSSWLVKANRFDGSSSIEVAEFRQCECLWSPAQGRKWYNREVSHFEMAKDDSMASAETAPSTDSPRVRRYRKAAELLNKWMAEDSGYDEQTWPALAEELKDSATLCQEDDEVSA